MGRIYAGTIDPIKIRRQPDTIVLLQVGGRMPVILSRVYMEGTHRIDRGSSRSQADSIDPVRNRRQADTIGVCDLGQ
jgi:hypothetical protein